MRQPGADPVVGHRVAFEIEAGKLHRRDQELPVSQPEQELIVVGEDRVGAQISPQERMTPLIAVLVLLVESMALAGLVVIGVLVYGLLLPRAVRWLSG